MKYEYNGNLLFEDRLDAVAKDILLEYPTIPFNIAKYIAAMEIPITTEVTDEMRFRRLYNILYVCRNKKEIKVKLFNQLIHTYQNIYGRYSDIDHLMDKIMYYMVNGGIFPEYE